MNTYSQLSIAIGVIGAIASLTGLIVAAIQTIRIKSIKRSERADIWLTIRIIKSQLFQLEKRDYLKDPNLSRVYDASINLFRSLLKRAVLLENNFSEETISKWKSVGKITSDWQVNQAKNYLETKDINP